MNWNKKISIGTFFFVVCFLFTQLTVLGDNDTTLLPPFTPDVDAAIETIMLQNYIPSVATAVMRNNSVIWAKGYGEQNAPDLIYQTGSVGKTFVATAFFQLYERGLIELDDDANEYLPFSLRHPNYTDTTITIQMLLTHYSGLNKSTDTYDAAMYIEGFAAMGWEFPYEWLEYPLWIEELLTQNGTLYDPEAWSSYEPGTAHVYSNIGYDILSYILQNVTGQTSVEYMQENIFDPLEMDHTSYDFNDFETSQLALPYYYNFSLDPEPNKNKAYPLFNEVSYGAGAIRSNVYDLSRFLLVHINKGLSNGTRILEESSMNLMHQIHASWYDDIFDKWGGIEGDTFGYHTKAYTIHSSNTTVPYAVVTLVNQGSDEARDACYNINLLLRQYVHEYDVLEYSASNGFIFFISIFSIVLIVLIRKKKY